jgi:uncharacterized ferritin-like protein (DUF455 family)
MHAGGLNRIQTHLQIGRISMGAFSSLPIDWSPFTICAPGEKAPSTRALTTVEGLGDRLRFVAFAEMQAHHAFAAATTIFQDAPAEVRNLWSQLSIEEEKHLHLLLNRMQELGESPAARPQSLALWNSFDHCKTAADFAKFMSSAEDWGKSSGEKFHQTLLSIDPVTAALFKRIAEEEVEHIRLASMVLSHFPELRRS